MSINFKDELSHSNPTYSIVDESNIRGVIEVLRLF
jgi:hypothetical protein